MNSVYIAQSLDGYISDKNNSLKWLEYIPNPDNLDLGYNTFMNSIDALVMGRKTFETICAFDIPWPYEKPVFVLSNKLKQIPDKAKGKVEIINGELENIIEKLQKRNFKHIYIDGGKTIQSFLEEGLIDQLIITTFPILLGGGTSLFGNLDTPIDLQHVKTEVLLEQMTQSTYKCHKEN